MVKADTTQVAPRVPHWKSTVACVLVMMIGIAIVHPVLEGGYSDDFSYIYSAKRAAETGRLIYNGWATAFLGFQVYFGALFIKLFGFSFTITRAAGWTLALLNVAVLHRLFLRLTGNNVNAVVGALTMTMARTTLAHSVVFFTDLPAMFAFTATFYLCVCAMQAETPAEMKRWLILATVCNLVLGSVRQTAWGGALALVPATGWHLRRHPGVLRLTIALEVVSVAVVGAAILWFNHAPYAVHEKVLGHLSLQYFLIIASIPLCLLVELAPLLIGLLGLREVRKSKGLLLAGTGTALAAFVLTLISPSLRPLIPGVLLGFNAPHADVVGVVLIVLAAFGFGVAVALGSRCFREVPPAPTGQINFRILFLVTLPYFAASAALVMTRNGLWPRYIMTLTPVAAALLLRIYAERSHGNNFRFPAIAAAAIASVFAVVAVHDDLLVQRPTLAVEHWAVAQGIPRNQIEAGMPEDGWYEISTGHAIHDARIQHPDGANAQRFLTMQQQQCHEFGLRMFPEIHSVYSIRTDPSPCVQGAPLHAETQTFWLRPTVTEYLYRFTPLQQFP